jgi:NAD(P)-dependent dehydrogenase (short-subunit alcohol dehydrogenase family)
VLADLHENNAAAAAEVLANAGFDVSTAAVDVASRESVHALADSTSARGDITGVIHAAGVSPSQAGRRQSSPSAPNGAFITGSDFLMEGCVTASYFFGDLAPE